MKLDGIGRDQVGKGEVIRLDVVVVVGGVEVEGKEVVETEVEGKGVELEVVGSEEGEVAVDGGLASEVPLRKNLDILKKRKG